MQLDAQSRWSKPVMTDSTTCCDKWAARARSVLLALIAVLLALIVAGPENRGIGNPLTLSRAQAEGVAAAPGHLVLTSPMTNDSKFYLIDTTRKVVCVYNLNGSKMRLVAARKMDHDAEIVDSSVNVTTADGKSQIKSFEGGNGIDRSVAKDYSEGLKKMLEAATKK